MDFAELYLIVISAVTFGYVLAAVLVETRVVNWLGIKTLSLSRLGLHPLLTNVPVLYLISPRAAHVTASELLRSGKISPTDLYLAVLASNLPMRLMFLYRYYFPVLLPLIGMVAVYYALLRLAFDLIIFVVVSLIGKKRYKERGEIPSFESFSLEINASKLKSGLIKGTKEALLFAVKFTPVFAAVVFLIKFGAMEFISSKLSPILGKLGFNPLEITYATTAAISPPVAYGLIKVMIKEGIPTTHVIGTMAVGNALFSALRSWWTYLLPYYLGLYPPRVTAVLLLLQAGLPIVYNLSVGLILVNLF